MKNYNNKNTTKDINLHRDAVNKDGLRSNSLNF